jgi:iron(III) transport system ATP-binding protein
MTSNVQFEADDEATTASTAASSATVLDLEGVSKTYGADEAVRDVSLSVRDGELLTLLGPSGCGKTTTLRMIAGLETPDAGTISLRGDQIAAPGTAAPPETIDVGIVFQEYALFPHLSVAENVAFGLTDADATETNQRVAQLLELVDLPGYGDRMPENLSGGQRQRVALARSLAPEPDVLLLDEPFSNLDVRLRVTMREEVRRILKETGVTAISVTHDQEEALSISDRVAIMHEGQIEQIDSPERVFEHPRSRFVANFLGQAGFVTGTVRADGVETPLGTIKFDQLSGDVGVHQGAMIDVLVRPDDLLAAPTSAPDADGRISYRQYHGPSFVYRVDLDAGDVVHCQHNHVQQFELDQAVTVDLVADHPLAWFPVE